jgi:DNA topoisomerase I
VARQHGGVDGVSKNLIIVESPAKAKTIEKFLGRKYIVKASMGHVRDLPKSQLGVNVDEGFAPKYITIRGKGDILKELRETAKKADKVFLATDPDREGEAISWHLAQVLNIPEDQPVRIEFHEITKDAIQKAIKKPRPIESHRVEAQQARRILDRLVGYKLSPLLWRKVRRGLSAGRVQSVAVRLIVDREEEIRAFVPEEYWSLTARLNVAGGASAFPAKYWGTTEGKVELKAGVQTDAVVQAVTGQAFVVHSVTRKERKRNPAFPFTTSSLQQEASRKLGFTVRRTMAVAQQLYEGLDLGDAGHTGLVTYIRTDSRRIAAEAEEAAKTYIGTTYGPEYIPTEKREAEKKAGEQGAHEAIRPTEVTRTPDSVKQFLNNDQYKLYKLVWERFVSSQMAPAILDTVSVDIAAPAAADGAATVRQVFRATGSTLKFPGFMKIYIESRDEEAPEEEEGLLPELTEGQALTLVELDPKQHFTQPPARYSEAMLVKALEERGIGRPSTYAPIIDTIQARGYVEKQEKRFVPTELGQLVIKILKEYFDWILDVEFTAKMEGELDQVEEGEAEWRKVLEEFFRPFELTLKEAEEKVGGFELQDEETDIVCDRCGERKMVVKYGRFGKFLACPGFPDCKNTKPILEETGVKCPECGEGMIVERKAKKGGRKFYGCSRYPECNFVSWEKPVAKGCPECGAKYLVEKKLKEQGLVHMCKEKECTYMEQVEEMEEVSV